MYITSCLNAARLDRIKATLASRRLREGSTTPGEFFITALRERKGSSNNVRLSYVTLREAADFIVSQGDGHVSSVFWV